MLKWTHARKGRKSLAVGILLLLLASLPVVRVLRPSGRPQFKYQAPGPPPTTYTLPGEFEKQQAVWLQWPSAIYEATDHPVSPVMVAVIKALAPHVRVNLMVSTAAEIKAIGGRLTAGGFNGRNLTYYLIPHQSIWARDVGPVFVKDNQNRLRVADFGFNNYSRDGDPQYIKTEGQVHRLVAAHLGLPLIGTPLISEGGGIESNGKGTLMVTASVALKRNPGLSKQQVEAEYKRVLGVKKVIWLNQGLAEDDRITSGHINEIARFAGPHTVLLAQVLPGDRQASWWAEESYRRLEENYRILSGATDQDGKPLRIIRIPMPPGLYAATTPGGSLPVRSYLNYALTNGAVLMPVYWRPGRPEELRKTEQQVQNTLRAVFPGREVIGLDVESVNLWGGGLHCITQHMPAVAAKGDPPPPR